MKARVTPLGWVLLALIAGGVIVFFAGSGVAAAIGAVVAVLAILFIGADQLPVGVGGGWVLGKGRPGISATVSRREPEYIERTVEPSEELWARERERMRDKAEEA